MDNENNLETAIDTVNISLKQHAPVLHQQKDGVYTFGENLDKFIEEIDKIKEYVNQTQAVSEDDRKTIAKTKATTNKYLKSLKKQISDEQKHLFDGATAEYKAIEKSLNRLTNAFKMKLDAFDTQYREEKLEQLDKFVKKSLLYHDFKDKISTNQLLPNNWFNRTQTTKTIQTTINERIESIISLNSIIENMDNTINLLLDNDWNLAVSIQKFTSPEEHLVTKTITLPENEVEKLVTLAEQNGWNIE